MLMLEKFVIASSLLFDMARLTTIATTSSEPLEYNALFKNKSLFHISNLFHIRCLYPILCVFLKYETLRIIKCRYVCVCEEKIWYL